MITMSTLNVRNILRRIYSDICKLAHSITRLVVRQPRVRALKSSLLHTRTILTITIRGTHHQHIVIMINSIHLTMNSSERRRTRRG